MSLHFLPYFWRWLISTGSKIYICKNTVNGTVCSISLIRSSHTPPVDIIKGNSWMWESLSPARNLQLWVWSVRRTFSWKKFKQKKKKRTRFNNVELFTHPDSRCLFGLRQTQRACVILGEAEVWTFVFVVDVVSQTEKESSLSQLQCGHSSDPYVCVFMNVFHHMFSHQCLSRPTGLIWP